jgi:N-acetylglucosaminyldiphosphoundecaprenol N-acetyl-beta-D-mannosaminyltransferase
MLRRRFPKISIVGAYSPPCWPLSQWKRVEITENINRAASRIVWVGLRTRQRECSMHDHLKRLSARVLVGTGAQLDMQSGSKKQALASMPKGSIEWSFRLLHGPLRLWHRYVVCCSRSPSWPPWGFSASTAQMW